MKPRVALIGPGRLGQALTALLRRAGYPVVAVIGRDAARNRAAARFIGLPDEVAGTELTAAAAADILLLCVADDALRPLAQALHASGILRPTHLLIHCSGLHPADILTGSGGCARLALHPLQTFATAEQGLANLPGSFMSLQGEATALAAGEQLVRDLGGHHLILSAELKPLYHAAACLVSNYVTSLIACACDLLAEAGPARQHFPQAFAPLLHSAIANSLALGPEQALTGPIVRGDAGTLACHLQAIAAQHPALLPLYRALADQTLELAGRSGRLAEADRQRLAALLHNPAPASPGSALSEI
ncbi:Rossmann-like and DUF2520 domain-containing protein [Desulfuromonas thiophila]|uniref:Predicted oxidoreductase, contains short-chain dehydrogenase (SDR) and DUF2520 domains n=1 Tax=Desulfuromonas thiophila TaxID=57664 RepID=A0A1G6Y0A8_9BACT|nr:Rossmann-like and DUF2520 domain-containing protein [Desulfuromonas thiophila]SDD83066.1 Predicted oxidoreductase, contains short-chain dehydrogenase (SDR) and DUF2520 domains [Desulfuromonas thiophila]